jgi:hypothetical protein
MDRVSARLLLHAFDGRPIAMCLTTSYASTLSRLGVTNDHGQPRSPRTRPGGRGGGRWYGKEGTGWDHHDRAGPRCFLSVASGGTSDRSPEPGRAGTSYYLAPADKGGEPPGRWQGGGVADLDFREGQVNEREVFERLYGKFLDPRDPTGETRLGRAPQRFRCGEAPRWNLNGCSCGS